MAGQGRRTFAPGEVLTATNVMNYLQDQAVMNFADDSARGSAIGTAVSEGMVSYLADSDSVEVYDGASWFSINTKWVSYTPTYTNFTLGNGTIDAAYYRSGNFVAVRFELTIGSTSSMTGALIVSKPFTAIASNNQLVYGTGQFFDTSANNFYPLMVTYSNSNNFRFWLHNAAGTYAVRTQYDNTTPVTVATGDTIKCQFFYQAA
jgi:hypothetical protein